MPVTPPPAQPTVLQVALGGLCPRCGAKTLFAGFARFAPACSACRLDLSEFNVGDGPAGFMTLAIGGLITGLAIWLELSTSPPWWLHVLLWLPLAALAVIVSLRYSKAAMLALEYRNRAREGRIVEREE